MVLQEVKDVAVVATTSGASTEHKSWLRAGDCTRAHREDYAHEYYLCHMCLHIICFISMHDSGLDRYVYWLTIDYVLYIAERLEIMVELITYK